MELRELYDEICLLTKASFYLSEEFDKELPSEGPKHLFAFLNADTKLKTETAEKLLATLKILYTKTESEAA